MARLLRRIDFGIRPFHQRIQYDLPLPGVQAVRLTRRSDRQARASASEPTAPWTLDSTLNIASCAVVWSSTDSHEPSGAVIVRREGRRGCLVCRPVRSVQ